MNEKQNSIKIMKQNGPIVDILCIILGIVTRKVRITEKILV
jgi:hypothetical protein